MSGYMNTVKNAILDAGMGGALFERKGPFYLALTTVAVTGADTGVTITEPTWTGYARILMEATDWNAAAAGVKTNKNEVLFPECTAGEGSHIGWAYTTAKPTSTGLVICSGVVPVTVISKGITPKFAAGALSFSLIDT